MNNRKLSPDEEKFCLVFVCGPAPYNGNAQKTFELVFKKTTGLEETDDENGRVFLEVDNSLEAHQLMLREEIQDRIAELKSETIVNASTLTPRITAALLRIVDECSTLVVEDRWGVKVSPAALRSVAVNAAGKLMDMYGIKEDIAHKVVLESAEGDGITFNLVMPESNKENEFGKLIE